MIVDHETREIVRTVVFCGPPHGEFPKLMDRLYASLSAGHGAEKRTHCDRPSGAGPYSFAQVWLESLGDYDSYLHLFCLNDVADPKDGRWQDGDAFILVHDHSPKVHALTEVFIRKFEKVRSANPGFVFDDWRTPAEMTDPRSDLLSLLPAVHSRTLGPPVGDDEPVGELPAVHEFESRINNDPGFWLEQALVKALTSRPPPREQLLYIEERGPRFQVRYPLPAHSLYSYIAEHIFEPRSFIEIKRSGYRRLYHYARRSVVTKAQKHFATVLKTTGQTSTDPSDMFHRFVRNQMPVSPSVIFSLLLVHQHLTGSYDLEDLPVRLRASFLAAVDEMLMWFSEVRAGVKNFSEIPVLFEVLKDRIMAAPIDHERIDALYKLALLIHADPTGTGHSTAIFS